MQIGPGVALLIIDVQNDFCAGGALAVSRADAVVNPLNRLIAAFTCTGAPVFASRDWHPAVTAHFTDYGGIWPVHCVADTPGAEFHHELRLPAATVIVSKGQDPESHGYSAFDGRLADDTTLADDLAARRVHHLYVGGLATDYCVRQSVLDARKRGLRVSLVTDAIAGVNIHPKDAERALIEMCSAGAETIITDDALT